MNCVEKSIKEKWEPIRDGEHYCFDGDGDCACCLAHWACSGCPIFNYTGKSGCKNTPYDAAVILAETFIENKAYDLHAECTAAAQWEINFLNEVNRDLNKVEV